MTKKQSMTEKQSMTKKGSMGARSEQYHRGPDPLWLCSAKTRRPAVVSGAAVGMPVHPPGDPMDHKKNGNLLYATRNALAGFPVLLRENAARREILVVLFALACAIHAPGPYAFGFLALSIVLLAVEALNTAIEVLCDHTTAERHPDIKAIKDVAAAAVFLMVLLTVGAGFLFLADYLDLLGPPGG